MGFVIIILLIIVGGSFLAHAVLKKFDFMWDKYHSDFLQRLKFLEYHLGVKDITDDMRVSEVIVKEYKALTNKKDKNDFKKDNPMYEAALLTNKYYTGDLVAKIPLIKNIHLEIIPKYKELQNYIKENKEDCKNLKFKELDWMGHKKLGNLTAWAFQIEINELSKTKRFFKSGKPVKNIYFQNGITFPIVSKSKEYVGMDLRLSEGYKEMKIETTAIYGRETIASFPYMQIANFLEMINRKFDPENPFAYHHKNIIKKFPNDLKKELSHYEVKYIAKKQSKIFDKNETKVLSNKELDVELYDMTAAEYIDRHSFERHIFDTKYFEFCISADFTPLSEVDLRV